MASNGMVEAALKYAAKGWAVIPLHTPVPGGGCSCGGKVGCKVGKHPRISEWPIKATGDCKMVERWWAQWPDANVGIVTGAISDLLVLDVDDKNDGPRSVSIACLEAQHGALPLTLTASTGFGRHHYFRHPGRAVSNRVGMVGVGLDIRADRGYVAAPPSVHASGALYEWANEGTAVAHAPDWLVDLIMASGRASNSGVPRSATAVASRETPFDAMEIIGEGQRNGTLFRLASSMRGKGMDEHEIERALLEVNAAKCRPSLGVEEVRNIAAGVERYVPGKRPAAMAGVPSGKDPLFWMKFFPREVLAHRVIAHLTDYQFGWRMRLWLEAWGSGGTLPNNVRALATLAHASEFDLFRREMHEVLFDFEAIEVNGEAVLINGELAALHAEQMKLYSQKCEASAKAVEARKRKAEAEHGAEVLGGKQ